MKSNPTEYSRQLSDPRWQKRRLEIMQKSNWRCVCCGCGDQELHVHHKAYNESYKNPWDYPDDELECLCNDCHVIIHMPAEKLSCAHVRNQFPVIGELIYIEEWASAIKSELIAYANLKPDHKEALKNKITESILTFLDIRNEILRSCPGMSSGL